LLCFVFFSPTLQSLFFHQIRPQNADFPTQSDLKTPIFPPNPTSKRRFSHQIRPQNADFPIKSDLKTPIFLSNPTSKRRFSYQIRPQNADFPIKMPFFPPQVPAQDGLTPLHVAAFSDQRPIVALAIAHGADVNTPCQAGFTALHYAIMGGAEDTALWVMLGYGGGLGGFRVEKWIQWLFLS
jgi:ankyrin repeat protein